MITHTFQELKQGGQIFQDYVIILDCNIGYTKNQDPFLTFRFGQKEKEVEGKLWKGEFPLGETEQMLHQKFKAGTIVQLRGETTVFRDKLQIKITSIEAVADDDPNVNIGNLIRTAPLPAGEIKKEINRFIENIEDPTLRSITTKLFMKFDRSFFRYPAASKNHHAYVGGLAYHTLSMARIAEALFNLYPIVNKDVLMAGVLLHDMGKCKEISGPLDASYTVEGNMIGHITLMVMEIDRTAQSIREELQTFDDEKVIQLIHLIQSHHGKMEYGSPKEPMTLEAMLLHQVDMIDSRIEMFKEGTKEMDEGTVEYTHPLGRIYKPTTTESR
ncbi:3'-5' exoribonuclease YhaM family protein [Bacillus piscicola]|uniref:3'-5' exoribonuclease YhaM family protein n=1 Tax=Bacillus piscicola TaxID=1632684 RepID=UPI001F09545B|nr:HD domain-containing protein [Bacillus piscicola]